MMFVATSWVILRNQQALWEKRYEAENEESTKSKVQRIPWFPRSLIYVCSTRLPLIHLWAQLYNDINQFPLFLYRFLLFSTGGTE